MSSMKTTVIIMMLIAVATTAFAQDPLFSQTWHSPVYTNPALAGTAKSDWRVAAVYRQQWMRIPGGMRHISLSAEKQFREQRIGFSLLMNHSNEGYLKTNGVYGVLNKEVELNDNAYLNFAVAAGRTWRVVDPGDFLFADQIDRNGPVPGRSSGIEGLGSGGTGFTDISPGIVLTWRSIMIGGAVHHLYNNDQGLFGDKNQLLPRRYTAHVNVLLDLDADDALAPKIKPGVFLNVQGKSTFLKMGALAFLPAWGVELSGWYNNNTGFSQGQSFSLGVNIRLGKSRNAYNSEAGGSVQYGFSFDREMANALPQRTFGSLEAGAIYEHSNDECPKPYGGNLKKYPWAFL
jgi:type IX secretion system PorP/SprF family membrane protein